MSSPFADQCGTLGVTSWNAEEGMALNRFGQWLGRRMEEQGIGSQRELGRRIGTTGATVSRWMSGEALPSAASIAAAAP